MEYKKRDKICYTRELERHLNKYLNILKRLELDTENHGCPLIKIKDDIV